MGRFFGKSSNDTQENPKDALKKEEELKEVREENAKLNRDKTDLTREKDKLASQNTALTTEKDNLTKDKTDLTNKNAELQKRVKELEQSQQALKNGNDELLKDREKLTTQNTELAEKIKALTTEKTELNNKITRLTTDKENLTKDKENLTTELSTAKSQAEQTSQKLNELEQRHAPYQKLEKLYEVFLEVKDRLNFNFVATTHIAMDLIASVLSDSKYYLENLYNKASQELSDKGEKLAELFDLLFEYIKDSKFERLKEPSAYDHSCKTLYPEQNASQKMQRVVLRGYTYDKKIACHTIVDMGS
ncbi:hypothetical protein KVM11_00520 [Helicobacter pylori]|nr:hypothetical protein KVM11_00520 [Helicobacter pylori]